MGEVRLIDGDHPPLPGSVVFLHLDSNHDAAPFLDRIPVNEHQIGIPLADRPRLFTVALDLGPAIDGHPVHRPPDPEDVERQPRVFLEEREESLVQSSGHILCVGPRKPALQGFSKNLDLPQNRTLTPPPRLRRPTNAPSK